MTGFKKEMTRENFALHPQSIVECRTQGKSHNWRHVTKVVATLFRNSIFVQIFQTYLIPLETRALNR